MNRLKNPKVQGALRHLLTATGPVLALIMASDDPGALVRSLFGGAGWPALVGVLMAGLGFWASWTAKEKAT
jgi:Mn2+/Fe2+ NRAMP family transporter